MARRRSRTSRCWSTSPGCIGRGDPCRVDAEGGRSSPTMAEAPSDGAQADAGREELGGPVVPQCINMSVDTQAFGHVLVAAGDGVR
jgi:hypothetical protein